MTTPELPIELPPGTALIEVVSPMPCAMLRCGMSCTNDATFVLMCPDRHSTHRLVPFCDMCMREVSAVYADWLGALERVVSPPFVDWTANQ